MVRIARLKFQELEPLDAVTTMFNESLASFSDGGLPAQWRISDDALAVVAAANEGLRFLYEGYFRTEVDGLIKGAKASKRDMNAEACFIKLCSDFEVIAGARTEESCTARRKSTDSVLLPKAVAFSVFREAAKVRSVPKHLCLRILAGNANRGRQFTLAHFCVALMIPTLNQICNYFENAENAENLLERWLQYQIFCNLRTKSL